MAIVCLICDSAIAQQVRTNQGGTPATGTPPLSTAAGGGEPVGVGASNLTTGPAGFVGANMNQEFIGAGREAVTNTANNRQFRAIQDTSMRQNTRQQQSGTPRQMPVSLKVGFELPSLNSVRGSLDAANNPSLDQYVSSRPELNGLQVRVSPEGIATLTGTIRDSQSSRVAANLVRFQPGIRSIDNQLQVTE